MILEKNNFSLTEPIKIALVNPLGFNKNLSTAAPPHNLGHLASYLIKHVENAEVRIIDGLAGQAIENKLIDFQPNIIGITATTPAAQDAYRIADFAKQNIKNSILVMGGLHASVLPDEALNHVDIVVIGEGEQALLEIVNNVLAGKDIQEKKITRPFLKNLDEALQPAWHLMDLDFYIRSEDNTARIFPYSSVEERALTIITSRGCPYRCIFCHNSWRPEPVRYHSAEYVVKEIEELYNQHKITSFFFADDEFLVNKSRLLKICSYIREKGLDQKILWGCQARSDAICRLGLETLELVKKNGCTMIAIGMESGSQKYWILWIKKDL